MAPDRSWMYRQAGQKSLRLEPYLKGVNEFLSFAFSHEECVDYGRIQCPCRKCKFSKYQSHDDVQMCLLRNGFTPNYTRWTRHGESNLDVNLDVEANDNQDNKNNNRPREMSMDTVGPNYVDRIQDNYATKLHDKLANLDVPINE